MKNTWKLATRYAKFNTGKGMSFPVPRVWLSSIWGVWPFYPYLFDKFESSYPQWVIAFD